MHVSALLMSQNNPLCLEVFFHAGSATLPCDVSLAACLSSPLSSLSQLSRVSPL